MWTLHYNRRSHATGMLLPKQRGRALVPALPHRPWFLKSFTSAQPGSYILLYPGGPIKILISQT